jgi:deoxyribodipyrimidine photo-lyase
VIDQSYAALDQLARQPPPASRPGPGKRRDCSPTPEPWRHADPPDELGWTLPKAASVAGRDVWLVHPWSLGALPAKLPAGTVVIGIFVADFHGGWPWSAQRWLFVGSRMAELATERWHGDAAVIGAALKGARSVRSIDEPHLAPWLTKWAACEAAPALFARVDRRCDSFTQWWTRVTRGLNSAADLLAINEAASS